MGRLRIASARFMIRLGRLLQSLAVTVMRSDDLIEFSRRTYAQPASVADWGRAELVDKGLSAAEQELLEQSPLQAGRLLLLGLGGGREAIALTKRGFTVTGVDFIAAMVEKAQANAVQRGVSLETLVQEISLLDLPDRAYDLAWLSSRMYSCIPTRRRRVDMLKRIARSLRSGGCYICQFHWEPQSKHNPMLFQIQRAVAWLSWGHLEFEPGDMLWFNIEFIHAFRNEAQLSAEFAEGGFEVLHLSTSVEKMCGGAILKRKGREAG